MEVYLEKFNVKTKKHAEMLEITREVEEIVFKSGILSGYCMVYIPHTTAAVTINENADPDVVYDFTKELDKIVPWQDHYRHAEGNSAAHIKASMMGFSGHLIIDRGKLILGTWQGIYLLEYDGPRTRTVYVKLTEG